MTLKEGLDTVSQSALRDKVKERLRKLAGPLSKKHGMGYFEKIAKASYKKALEDGSFIFDDSKLIEAIEAPADVLNLCDASMPQQIENAKKYRFSYLNDVNFFRYLNKF